MDTRFTQAYNYKTASEAIKKIKPRKVAGPDWLSCSYYKCFDNEVSQPSQNLRTLSFRNGICQTVGKRQI